MVFVLCLAGCSSGGARQSTPTTTPRRPVTPMTCVVRAAGSPNASGPAPTESDFPPADVKAPAGTHPMTASRAIRSALGFGMSDGRTPPASEATATEVAYRSAEAALGDRPDPRIAPNRCVWKVTVDATYDGFPGGPPQIGKRSPSATAAQASSYSVIFDVNSGFMFEIIPTY